MIPRPPGAPRGPAASRERIRRTRPHDDDRDRTNLRSACQAQMHVFCKQTTGMPKLAAPRPALTPRPSQCYNPRKPSRAPARTRAREPPSDEEATRPPRLACRRQRCRRGLLPQEPNAARLAAPRHRGAGARPPEGGVGPLWLPMPRGAPPTPLQPARHHRGQRPPRPQRPPAPGHAGSGQLLLRRAHTRGDLHREGREWPGGPHRHTDKPWPGAERREQGRGQAPPRLHRRRPQRPGRGPRRGRGLPRRPGGRRGARWLRDRPLRHAAALRSHLPGRRLHEGGGRRADVGHCFGLVEDRRAAQPQPLQQRVLLHWPALGQRPAGRLGTGAMVLG